MSEAYGRIVEALLAHGAKREGRNFTCPVHNGGNEDHPSLTVDDGRDRALVHCKVGCSTAEVVGTIGLTLNDLFDGRRGCTLDLYAQEKRLPYEFLLAQGLKDQKYQGAPSLRIPYLDQNGRELSVRYRLSLNGADRFRWKAGNKPCLYGTWRLKQSRKAGFIVLVEGESDVHTLWHHGLPAVGLPGAALWNEERDAELLLPFDPIYVVIEPDVGGDAVLRWLSKSRIRDRVRLVQLDAGDVSDSYLANIETFTERFEAALEASVPWEAFERERASEVEQAAFEACGTLAREESILTRLSEDLERCGLIGEERQAKILYLALTSRMFARPVSVVLKGASSGGKSFIAETVLEFFPASAYYALSAMSERALAYSEEPLSHRFLVLYEAQALEGDFASYLVRSLLSEGCVRYETVEKTEDGLRPRLIERPGPTGLLVTTTSVQLHPENETRMLSLPITDTPQQTKAIIRALAEQRDASVDLTQWHALQQWIASRAAEVVIPYAPIVADLIPPVAVRLRRDVRTFFNLVAAHALLQQASREREKDGRVIATIDDYAVVRELVADFMAEGVAATVSQATRETVSVVQAHEDAGFAHDDDASANPRANPRANRRITVDFTEGEGMSVSAIAQELGIDVSAAHRRVSVAVKGGYLKNLETKPRRKGRYVLDNPLPEEVVILPSVDEVVCRFAQLSGPQSATNFSSADDDEKSHDVSSLSRNRANVQTDKKRRKTTKKGER